MARPKTTLVERVNKNARRAGSHLIWDGPMRGSRPLLRHFGNPVRVLLNLVDQPRIQVKPLCLEPRCIEPDHWKVIKEKSFKYDDAPPPEWDDPRSEFAAREEEEIRETVEGLKNGEMTLDELEEYPPPAHIKAEILRRYKAA